MLLWELGSSIPAQTVLDLAGLRNSLGTLLPSSHARALSVQTVLGLVVLRNSRGKP